jgi:glucosamine-6-phosphate deaminase
MRIIVAHDVPAMGRQAAHDGAGKIRDAIAARGKANIILATGSSQFSMLASLQNERGIAWQKVSIFHLDEYVGLPATHPASFRKYLRDRFINELPVSPREFYAIDAETDPVAEAERLSAVIAESAIDVAFVGIGENGHLAFNDPPADFENETPYLVVRLDEACRRQQLGEGWFPTLEAVPKEAISMSCRQILKSKSIICTVPDRRKAQAVRDAVEGPITPAVPASILQRHTDVTLYLDPQAAELLKQRKEKR